MRSEKCFIFWNGKETVELHCDIGVLSFIRLSSVKTHMEVETLDILDIGAWNKLQNMFHREF
jgi:hypothetical protein